MNESESAANFERVGDVVTRAVQAQQAWFRTGIAERIEIARRYADRLTNDAKHVAALITQEVSKLPSEAEAEVKSSIAKVWLSIDALADRRSDGPIDPPESLQSVPVERWVRYAPLGLAVVLGPFNFPLHLPGGQIIPALLAGNAVIFKPSEMANGVARWMVQAWRDAGLPEHTLQLAIGGVATAKAIIDHPQINAVFLTGSHQTGLSIHSQLAGRPHVLLAMELGGNNPMVIDHAVAPERAAELASFSAFVSAGQRCTCARRAIFVDGPSRQTQIQALVQQTESLSVGMPDDKPEPDIGPLASAQASERLQRSYEELLTLGGNPLVPLSISNRHAALISPAIVDGSAMSSAQREVVGQMEWFGPLLVVFRADDLADAFQIAAQTSYGLAASLLGGTEEDFEQFVAQVGAGVVNWNGPTTGAAGNLPFGGRGQSGNHRPAGYFAIDACSEPVSSIQRASIAAEPLWKPHP